MPELPEVETVRKGLSKKLFDFYIHDVEVCRESAIASHGGSKAFVLNLKGTTVGSWHRRGKYLYAKLFSHKKDFYKSNNSKVIQSGFWGVHLRMTGQFQWHEKKSSPCPHTRVRFWNNEGNELRFVDTRSFGQMWWVPPGKQPEEVITGLKKLGPEPFSSEFNSRYLEESLKNKVRPIKSALLDQSLVAGIGNIYADEALFSAKVLPFKPSKELTNKEIERLYSNIKKVLKISIGKGGTTFSDFRDLEGINGNYGGQAWVYGREMQACRICGTNIQRKKLCGRSTHWCNKCQK